MKKKQKLILTRIILSALLTLCFSFVNADGIYKFFLFLIPYLIIGYDILKKAFHGIVSKQLFDENFLMALATVGAIILALCGSGDYIEAVAVMLFYQTGELFQSLAVGKSRKNISALMDIRPDVANVEKDGVLTKISPDEVEIGTFITVRPGEKVPIDGIVSEGKSFLDTSALTGESIPREVGIGDEILSGCINLNGVLKIKTTKCFAQSTVSKILDLVENASSHKSRSENFISKFAKIYTPAVCLFALLLFLSGPLFNILSGKTPMLGIWLYRALTFLVVSCPCALVISIPLSFFAGIGGASRNGILIKGSDYMEVLSKTKYVVFDKTGTLTEGKFKLSGVHHNPIDEEKLLEYAVLCESASTHPISQSLKDAYNKPIDPGRVKNIEEIRGKGIIAYIDGKRVAVGNDKLMDFEGVTPIPCHKNGTVLHICIDSEYHGHIVISDNIKETSREAVSALKKIGIKKTYMLTGDRIQAAQSVGKAVGTDEVYAELLPADKVRITEKILSEKQKGSALAFVGDGINDAPVLALSDVGIAMGAIGSDAAIEAADVVLMDDDPMKIATAVKIAKKCLRIVNENTFFAIAVKLLCLLFTALGISNMYIAIFADVGVMILCVLNAIRALK